MAQAAAAPLEQVFEESRPGPLRWVNRFMRNQPLGTAAAIFIALLALVALFQDQIPKTGDPRAFGVNILEGPSSEHLFGTNRQGRDIWTRVIYGARVSLEVGFATVLISLVGGTLIGLAAGYARSWFDAIISRLADVLIAFPAILFALTLATSFGPGKRTVIFAISVIFIPVIMRIMRGAVLQESSRAYVEAARVVGAPEWRVMLRHVLPNLGGLMIVTGSATLPAAILTESSLSFLGAGVPLGDPSWGGDLTGDARSYFTIAWWIGIFPGAALALTVLAFNLLGDSLAETLDPRLRGVR